MTFVPDASFVAKILLPDECASDAERRLAERALTAEAIAPSILPFELANILRTSVRRSRIDADASLGLYARYEAFAIAIEPAPIGPRAAETLRLANAHGLTFYDAAYLELSIRLDASLVSLDADLVKAARASNVAVALTV